MMMPFLTLSSLHSFWTSKRSLDKELTILFLIIILIAIGAITYILTSPGTAEKYTDFYILGREGKAENYPRELYLGQEINIVAGIVNWEYNSISYDLEIAIDGRRELELNSLVLNHTEKWEKTIVLKPSKIGERQKVEFRLYRDGKASIYRSLNLWINVNLSTSSSESSK